MLSCKAQYVGKNRNGTPRYWCITHHAPMSDGKGNILGHCLSAHNRIPECEDNSLTIDPSDYPGGITMWGMALAVYDTTPFPADMGVHVHAGEEIGGVRQIDKTFRYIHIKQGGEHSDTPHSVHRCQHCGQEFKTRMKSIGNPMEDMIRELSGFTNLPLKSKVITEGYPGLEGW